MPDILIRNVDDATLAKLKRRAERNGRSLQSEAKLLLEQASGAEDVAAMIAAWRERLAGRAFEPTAELIREDRER